MSAYKTPQEEFWAGDFGTEYSKRNSGVELLASNIALFSRVLARTSGIQSVIEFGANIGLNLQAIRTLLPSISIAGVELNESAYAQLKAIPGVTAYCTSLLDFSDDTKCDLTLSKGVLIHINPADLPKAYETLYGSSNRYVCIAEYYNPTPAAIPYRGHENRLFKRDFAGEMLDRFADLHLVDYGFSYHRDPVHPQDDITWFLLERGKR